MIRLLLFGLLLTVQATAYATIRYVKPGGDGTRTGESRTIASGDLQLMINASSVVQVDTIYIAAGTYMLNRPANDLNTGWLSHPCG
jgi:hypothetical protein